MNKKLINELAIEAGYNPIEGSDFHNSLNETFHENFAKLVVMECVKTFADFTPDGDHPGIDCIKKWFGVD